MKIRRWLPVVVGLAPLCALAQPVDSHSTLAIIEALSTPIPSNAVREAQEFHDAFLASGDFGGVPTFLITDDRSNRLRGIVTRLLTALGEDDRRWQVRLLDSDAQITNAFVTGGKYVYVFSGLTAEAESEDELAFVLSHELAHSLLKHNIRQEDDWSQQLARIAELAGAIAGGKAGRGLEGVARQIGATYSRVDEEEADALGVFIARRAGFDPLRGADFFTRSARADQRGRSESQAQVENAYRGFIPARNQCERLLAQWNADPTIRSQRNAVLLNGVCNDAEARRVHYNRTLASAQFDETSRRVQEIYSTHPPERARVAAVAALADHLEGRRDIFSLGEFQQTQRVVSAVREAHDEWFEASTEGAAPERAAAAEERHARDSAGEAPASLEERLRRLKAMLDEGLISESDYERKKQELIGSL